MSGKGGKGRIFPLLGATGSGGGGRAGGSGSAPLLARLLLALALAGFGLLILPPSGALAQEPAQGAFAIVNVTVLPMDSERVLSEQTVLVADGRILSVTPSAWAQVPAGTLQIDGQGLFLMPGLADMNINLTGYDSPAALALLLANGVTSARNFGGKPAYLDWRERISAGELDGPSLLTSGPLLAPASVLGELSAAVRPLIFLAGAAFLYGLGWVVLRSLRGREGRRQTGRRPLLALGFAAAAVSAYFTFFVFDFPDLAGPNVALVDSVREAERSPAAQRQRGYDFTALTAELTPDLYRALLRGSEPDLIRPAGEIPWLVGPQEALGTGDQDLSRLDQLLPLLQAGFDPSQPHGSYPLDSTAAAGAVRLVADASVTVCTALFLAEQVAVQADDPSSPLQRPEAAYLPAAVLRSWEPDQNVYFARFQGRGAELSGYAAALRSLVPRLADAGVRLVAGSSAGAPGVVWGFDIHTELETLVNAGLTPYQALVASTRAAAESLGQAGRWGVIAPGARADLLLLGSNPLHDITATRDIRGVMAAGRWYARSDLDRLLASVKPAGS